MGSPRVTSRPSAPRGGGGTGGGTTGGGTTTSSGGYDRYIGTLGAIADAPAGSKFPHYETFPAAEKYDWIRIVTTTTINDQAVFKGEEWICSAKTAINLPGNWERRTNLSSTGSEIKRELITQFELPPNIFRIIPFGIDDSRILILGNQPVAYDNTRTDLSLWFPSVFDNFDSFLDFDLVVNFSEEPSGDRFIMIGTLEYSNPPSFFAKEPNGDLVRGNNGISTAVAGSEKETYEQMKVESRAFVAATTQSQASIRSGEFGRRVRYFNELQTIFYVVVWQNSQKTIDVEKVSLSIRNRFPRGIL
jgi:hypothetical protein